MIKQIIAANMRQALENYKESKNVLKGVDRCPHCNQLIRNKYTQEWVGEQCGLSKATIVHYFQGTRSMPVERLIKIAQVLNVTVSYLLEGINPHGVIPDPPQLWMNEERLP